jgi:hypothetical protein
LPHIQWAKHLYDVALSKSGIRKEGSGVTDQMLVTKNFKRQVTRNSQLRSIRKSKTRYWLLLSKQRAEESFETPKAKIKIEAQS